MEILRHSSQTLSLEQRDSVNMTVSAEIARLNAEGLITHGDKYAFIYDILGGAVNKDRIPDQTKEQAEKDARTRRIRKLFRVSDEKIAAIFSGEAPNTLTDDVDKVAAFANMLSRLEDGDRAKIHKTFTTKYPVLGNGTVDRSYEDLIIQEEIDWVLLNFGQISELTHDEL